MEYGRRSAGSELSSAGVEESRAPPPPLRALPLPPTTQGPTDKGAGRAAANRDANNSPSSRAGDASASAHNISTEAQVAQVEAGGSGWGWEQATGWAQRRWQDLQQGVGQSWEAVQQAADNVQQHLSWKSLEEWQERHWQAFEERQRQRLAALTEEQRQRWQEFEERHRQRLSELTEEGEQLVRREIAAFEEWQQRYWAAHHPEEQAGAQSGRKPSCPQCRLSFLMLPLLPNLRENLDRFGLRTKMGIVGEMREAGTKLAGGCRVVGDALGVTGRKTK